MLENGVEMTKERKKEVETTILQTLFELYEHQTGAKYIWEPVKEKDETA